MKKLEIKKPRVMNPPPAIKKKASKPKAQKLSKKDPSYYSKIGAISAQKRKMTSEQYAEMARKSHPRPAYFGGRPKKDVTPVRKGRA
jgi:hypothetical protein